MFVKYAVVMDHWQIVRHAVVPVHALNAKIIKYSKFLLLFYYYKNCINKKLLNNLCNYNSYLKIIFIK